MLNEPIRVHDYLSGNQTIQSRSELPYGRPYSGTADETMCCGITDTDTDTETATDTDTDYFIDHG